MRVAQTSIPTMQARESPFKKLLIAWDVSTMTETGEGQTFYQSLERKIERREGKKFIVLFATGRKITKLYQNTGSSVTYFTAYCVSYCCVQKT